MEDDSVDSLWGYEHFVTFVDRWEKKYPTLKKYKTERNMAYFTYMDFPKEVQRVYTRLTGLKDSTESIKGLSI